MSWAVPFSVRSSGQYLLRAVRISKASGTAHLHLSTSEAGVILKDAVRCDHCQDIVSFAQAISEGWIVLVVSTISDSQSLEGGGVRHACCRVPCAVEVMTNKLREDEDRMGKFDTPKQRHRTKQRRMTQEQKQAQQRAAFLRQVNRQEKHQRKYGGKTDDPAPVDDSPQGW